MPARRPLAAPLWGVAVAVLLLCVPAGPPSGPAGTPPPVGLASAREAASAAVAHVADPAGSSGPAALPNASWQLSLSPGPVTAQGSLTGAAVAWDPRDGYDVLFGGNGSRGPTGTTWTFATGGWTNRTNASASPPAMYGASMDFDYNLDAVVLFGGCGPSACPSSSTWLYAGGTWVNVTNRSIDRPPARFDASLGFANDSSDQASILFGGCLTARCSSRANDTWALNTTLGWVPVALALSPPATSGASFTFDPPLGALVLFGGCVGASCQASNATWSYEAGIWSDIGTSIPRPFPPADPSPVATFESGTGRLLVVAGPPQGAGYSWALTCGGSCHWANLTGSLGPAVPLPGGAAALAAESGALPPILVGGMGAAATVFPPTSTWALEPLLSLEAAVAPSVAPARSTVQGTAAALGGTAPYVYDWTVGSEQTSAQNVTLQFSGPGTYSIAVVVSDAYRVEALANLTEQATGPSVAATASPGTVDEGIAVHFTAAPPIGGTPPYTISWQWPNGTTSYGSDVVQAFYLTGPQRVGILVTDARGVANQSSLAILVVAPPVVSITSPRSVTDVGGAVDLSVVVSGGVSPLSYNWTFRGGPPNTSGAAVSPLFPAPGVFPVEVQVIDDVGAIAVAWANVTVNPTLTAGVEASTSSGSWGPPSHAVNGTTLTLRAVPQNGTPNYTVSWRVTGPLGDVQAYNGTWLNLSINELGTYAGVVYVTDATGATNTTSFEFTSIGGPVTTCGSCGGSSDLLIWEIAVAVILVLAAVAGVAAAARSVRRKDRDR